MEFMATALLILAGVGLLAIIHSPREDFRRRCDRRRLATRACESIHLQPFCAPEYLRHGTVGPH